MTVNLIGEVAREQISAASTEFVKARVESKKNGLVYNPTSDVISMAFTADDTATGATFYTGSWETVTVTENGVTTTEYWARCLVGPAGGQVTLTPDSDRYVWVKIVDSPESPIRFAGILHVL